MKTYIKSLIIGAAVVMSAWLLGRAYTYKYRSQNTIVVTGLGETSFTSDLIVWEGEISFETTDVATGYAQLERSKDKVQEFITARGVPAESIVFAFVNVSRNTEPVYNANGNYTGSRFTGYRLSQRFVVESSEVERVENISREISVLISQGVSLDVYNQDYYYTRLDYVKLDLIQQASADARTRARKIAENAGASLGRVASAKMGVFQITGANSNEEFSAGGSFNTRSRQKKARVTMRVEYRIK